MENKLSDVSWVLVGVRPRTEEKIEEEVLQRLMVESFQVEKKYALFLCGTQMDKIGSLDEMEEGFRMIKANLEEYKDGDYCIISEHEEADLLFLPTYIEEDAQDLSRNIDSVQG